jgi:hypothetical protein
VSPSRVAAEYVNFTRFNGARRPKPVKRRTTVPEKAEKRAHKRTFTKTTVKNGRTVDHEQIATRAYFIYLEEGGGDEVENWLRAEHELTAA